MTLALNGGFTRDYHAKCRKIEADYQRVIADHHSLVRELDTAINGKNAAPQASLCDLVAQITTHLRSTEAELVALRKRLAEVEAQITAAQRTEHEIDQILGRALGYPRFADDPANFPGATDADGVCTGDHVAVTLATEAAQRIAVLESELNQVNGGTYVI